jgi:Domain of unknown function (DUF222)
MNMGDEACAAMVEPALMELPTGLDDMRPGPGLAAALASLDPTRLNCNQLAIVVCARLRQQSFEELQLLRAVRELVFAPRTPQGLAAPIRNPEQDPFTAMEMSFATTWTEYRSTDMVCLALLTLDKVPALGEALREGRIGLDKVRVFDKETELLDDEQRRAVAAAVLGEAETGTTAQLRQLLRRTVLKVNPEAVREKRRKAVEDRDVEFTEFANGTASLVGGFLDKDKAAAAFDYLDALARATKKAGDPLDRELGQLRADIFADLLAGVDPVKAGYARPADRKGVINLHVDLATLGCLADLPGEIAGFGHVVDEIARRAAADIAEIAQWRFTVTDKGEVLTQGILPKVVVREFAENLGRRRFPNTEQSDYVQARDKTCRAPGCQRRAMSCEIDHLHDYVRGGPTLVHNLCCLCKRHHRAKHIGGFKLRLGVHGVDWETPIGRRYSVIADGLPQPIRFEFHLTQLYHYDMVGQLRR